MTEPITPSKLKRKKTENLRQDILRYLTEPCQMRSLGEIAAHMQAQYDEPTSRTILGLSALRKAGRIQTRKQLWGVVELQPCRGCNGTGFNGLSACGTCSGSAYEYIAGESK